MKATGVIRKIDDLGRIVIPKEIRNNLKIRNGESIEIFIDNLDQIILKKYSLDDDYVSLLAKYVTIIYDSLGKNVFITDRNKIICSNSDIKNEYENKELSKSLIQYIDEIDSGTSFKKTNINFIEDKSIICSFIVKPIILSGECIGLLVVFDEENELNDTDDLVCTIATKFLCNYLEN